MAVLGFDFLRGDYALALPLAVVVLLLGIGGLRARRKLLSRMTHAAQRNRFAPRRSFGRGLLRLCLGSAALAFLILASMGPVRGYTLRETVTRGIDVVICIDTSRSMLAEDLRPSRIERARREVRGLLDALRGDRAALIAFAGDARDISPLTNDVLALKGLLEHVTALDNRLGGTDLAAALERALALFDGRTGSNEAIVIVTDGEDLEGRGLEVARAAADRGIRVFVVGVGTSAGGKIPVLLRSGVQGFLRGPDGEEVVTRLDGTTLERLAKETKGAYLSTENSAAPLETLYRERMSRIEGREVFAGQERIPHDRFQWPLLLGLLCMLGEAGLRERRGQGLQGQGPQGHGS